MLSNPPPPPSKPPGHKLFTMQTFHINAMTSGTFANMFLIMNGYVCGSCGQSFLYPTGEYTYCPICAQQVEAFGN